MQTFTGKEYVKIAIANSYGLDKELWDKRIEYADIAIADYRAGSRAMFDNADEPILMEKALRTYENVEAGIPTGFAMGLDATASGLQIIACLTGCKTTAENVNLINTGNREDVYSKVAQAMSLALGTDISRADIKKPLMTNFYGSVKQPENLFGKGTPELKAFYDAMDSTLVGAMAFMADIQGCWQPDVLFHQWTLPDGHVAKCKVIDTVDKKVEVDELDHATFTYRAKVNQPVEKGLSLAANVVHSIDGYVVREMYRKAKEQGFNLLTIHDAFVASPQYMNNVRKNYREILASIAEIDLMESIVKEILGTDQVTYTKLSTDLPDLIRQSEYALS